MYRDVRCIVDSIDSGNIELSGGGVKENSRNSDTRGKFVLGQDKD